MCVKRKNYNHNLSFCFFKMRGLFLFFSLLFFIILCVSIGRNKNSTARIIHSLSIKERKDFELLFHDFFAENELGYTLFGDKPMSFCIPNSLFPLFSKKDFTFRPYLDDPRPLFGGLLLWKNILTKVNMK